MHMDALGQDLLHGDPHGFFFVQALGGAFPVPTFLTVYGKRMDSSESIVMKGWKFLGESREYQDIHGKKNTCGWNITLSFGSKDNLANYAGTENEIREKAIEEYTAGDLKVYVMNTSEKSGLASMIAVNDIGYVSIISEHEKNAFWLINLFALMQETP